MDVSRPVVAAVGRAVAVVRLWTQEMGEGHSVRADEMSARRLEGAPAARSPVGLLRGSGG